MVKLIKNHKPFLMVTPEPNKPGRFVNTPLEADEIIFDSHTNTIRGITNGSQTFIIGNLTAGFSEYRVENEKGQTVPPSVSETDKLRKEVEDLKKLLLETPHKEGV